MGGRVCRVRGESGEAGCCGLRDCFIALLYKLNSAYLIFNEDHFDTISPFIYEILAVDTDSAGHIAAVFPNAVYLHMINWTGERYCVMIFEDFLKNKEKVKITEASVVFQACLQQHQQILHCIQHHSFIFDY